MQGLTRSKLSNLDKILYPELALSKADIIEYYIKAAPRMLPHLKDRALVRTRYPDGILGENFYEKDSPKGAPDWVKTFTKYSASVGKDTSFLFNINLKTSLTYTIKVGSAFFPVSLYYIHLCEAVEHLLG